MSALKRRFNFETVHPIADLSEEMALVQANRTGCFAARCAGLAPAGDHRIAGDNVSRARRGQDGRGKCLER